MKTLTIPIQLGHSLQITYLPNRRAYLRYCQSKTVGNVAMSGRGTIAKYFSYVNVPVDDATGEIVLYPDCFTYDVVAHEALHFVFDHFRKFGLDFNEHEEIAAQIVGDVTYWAYDWKEKADAHPKLHAGWGSKKVINFAIGGRER